VKNLKIVVLDGHAMNPGDLSWEPLHEIGDVVIYDKTLDDDFEARANDAHILLTNKTILNRERIDQCKNCQYIGVMASGYNVVDIDYAREKGIVVTNVPNYSTPTVAQHVFALLFEIYLRVGDHNRQIKQNAWANSQDFCFYQTPIMEVYNKTLGIIGFGNIGQAVAKIGHAFGMNLLIYDKGKQESHPLGEKVSWEYLLEQSDVISLHLPLTSKTKHIINDESFKMMKSNPVLINTARADLVDKKACIQALDQGLLSWYATDVMEHEPPQVNDPIIIHSRTTITGHMAWASKEARSRCINILSGNLKSFIDGNAINRVN
jgi:glycerate dehydrogenase